MQSNLTREAALSALMKYNQEPFHIQRLRATPEFTFPAPVQS